MQGERQHLGGGGIRPGQSPGRAADQDEVRGRWFPIPGGHGDPRRLAAIEAHPLRILGTEHRIGPDPAGERGAGVADHRAASTSQASAA